MATRRTSPRSANADDRTNTLVRAHGTSRTPSHENVSSVVYPVGDGVYERRYAFRKCQVCQHCQGGEREGAEKSDGNLDGGLNHPLACECEDCLYGPRTKDST